MKRSAHELAWIGVNISGRWLNNLRFAHDIVLIATSATMLQQLLDETHQISTEFQLKISSTNEDCGCYERKGDTKNYLPFSRT